MYCIASLRNFDVNVLTAAINSRGDSLVWFNLRKGVQRLKTELTGIIGFIVNVPVHHRFWRDGAHWYATAYHTLTLLHCVFAHYVVSAPARLYSVCRDVCRKCLLTECPAVLET